VAKKKRRPQPARSRPARPAAEEALPKAPVVLEAPLAMRIYAGLFGLAFFVVLALNAFATAKVHLSAIPVVLVVVGDLVCFRIFRTALVANDRGLIVRNYFRTYRYRWSDVADFRLDAPASRLDGWEMSVVTKGGKSIRLDALRRPFVRNIENNKPLLETSRRRLIAWLH
jgi:hypothetical protein